MRFWDRMRGSLLTDEVDPTLTELLPHRDPHRDLDALHLSRARVRVDSHLHEASPRGGLLRRMALAGFGGGGMWAGLVSVAAAHKAAAAAVGLSVLLAGTVAVETSGVGPAVREAVHDAVQPSGGGDSAANVGPAENSNAAVSVGQGNPLPGNLVTHLGPNGSFQLRGEIASADGTTLVLTTADGEVTFNVGGAEVHITGNPADGFVWSDYVGYGVIVSGSCLDPDPAESLADCDTLQVERVQLLGRAGQGGQPEDAGPPEDAGKPDDVPNAELPDAVPDGAGPPDDAPDGTGPPDDVPPSGPPNDAPDGAGPPDGVPPSDPPNNAPHGTGPPDDVPPSDPPNDAPDGTGPPDGVPPSDPPNDAPGRS